MRFRCFCNGVFPNGSEFESATGHCPKCKRQSPCVLVDVHYMVLGDGLILSMVAGLQRVACQPNRPGLAMHNQDMFSATGVVTAVTCPKCKATREWQVAAEDEAIVNPEFARSLNKG